MKAHMILYVADQTRATDFYSTALGLEPSLHVPGMTEYEISETCVLGLMPAAGIKRLLGEPLPDPDAAAGVPRCELYLRVADPERYHQRALAAGARELSALEMRGWGDMAAYSLDPDGHVLVFASL